MSAYLSFSRDNAQDERELATYSKHASGINRQIGRQNYE
jgi:hypothetical protein